MSKSSKLHTKQAQAARLRRLEEEAADLQRRLRLAERPKPKDWTDAVRMDVAKDKVRMGVRGPLYLFQAALDPYSFARSIANHNGHAERELRGAIHCVVMDLCENIEQVIFKAIMGDLEDSNAQRSRFDPYDDLGRPLPRSGRDPRS